MQALLIEQLLAAQPQLRPVYIRAQKLAQLQRIYSEIAPARLSRLSRVASLDGTTLILFADGGAVGAKLRLLAPVLINKFLLNGQEVTAIKVEVQANPPSAEAARPTAPPRGLPGEARSAFSAALENIADGPLRQAIQQLIK